MIRPSDELFDPRIADWLEEDPTRAPLDLLDDVLRSMPAIRQRPRHRLSWATRQRVVTPVAFAAGIAFAVVASLVLVGRPTREIAAPSTPPGPTALPAPSSARSAPAPSAAPTSARAAASAPPDLSIVSSLTKRYASPTYGFSIATRPNWVSTPATLPWTGPDNSTPVVDEIDFTGTASGMTAGSQELDPGETLDQWLAPFAANTGGMSPSCLGGDPATWPPVQVGDAVGRWQQMCNAAEVVVESGGRAYVFTWWSGSYDKSQQLSADDYKAVLTTVRFDPGAATPLPSAPPLTQSFTSPRNGFSIRYPAGWTATPATESWAPGTALDWGQPQLDALQSKTERFVVSTQRLNPGDSANDWLLRMCRLYEAGWVQCDTALPTWPVITVGAATGRIFQNGVGGGAMPVDGGRVFDAFMVIGDRGYEVTLDGLVDRATFDAMLESMTLDPASAVDASPSPT